MYLLSPLKNIRGKSMYSFKLIRTRWNLKHLGRDRPGGEILIIIMVPPWEDYSDE